MSLWIGPQSLGAAVSAPGGPAAPKKTCACGSFCCRSAASAGSNAAAAAAAGVNGGQTTSERQRWGGWGGRAGLYHHLCCRLEEAEPACTRRRRPDSNRSYSGKPAICPNFPNLTGPRSHPPLTPLQTNHVEPPPGPRRAWPPHRKQPSCSPLTGPILSLSGLAATTNTHCSCCSEVKVCVFIPNTMF